MTRSDVHQAQYSGCMFGSYIGLKHATFWLLARCSYHCRSYCTTRSTQLMIYSTPVAHLCLRTAVYLLYQQSRYTPKFQYIGKSWYFGNFGVTEKQTEPTKHPYTKSRFPKKTPHLHWLYSTIQVHSYINV